MQSLKLSPLPSHRPEDSSGSLLLEREGFVDEAVVRSMVSGTYFSRATAYPEDLALTADDSDFAGWQVTQTKAPRAAEVPPQVIDAIVRRAAPRATAETGTRSHSSKRRWWLAGLACALSTIGFSMLLLPLSRGPAASALGIPSVPPAASADRAAVQP